MTALDNVQLALPNIRGMARAQAIYLLRHVPSKKIFVGHTNSLRVRLHWWANRISSASNTGSIPEAMRLLLDQTGYDRSHWTFAVLDKGPFADQGEREDRFNVYLSRLQAQYPKLLLNAPLKARATSVGTYNPDTASPHTRGTSPRAWLKGRLKLGDPMPEHMPAHGWDIDPYVLTPTGRRGLAFAEYLYRSMVGTIVPHRKAGVYNPSVEAIRELFELWQRENKHDPAVQAAVAPLTVEQALLLPTPAEVIADVPIIIPPRVEHVPASRGEVSINVPAPQTEDEMLGEWADVIASDDTEDSSVLDRLGI